MPKFNASNIINRLNAMSEIDKNKKANTDSIIKTEINNVMEDAKISLYRQNREDAVKYALWQGLLNQYGLFGYRRNTKRLLGKNKNNLYDINYKHGDLVSIDFGTSNIDKEFSFTHTAIVLKSYTDYIVVIPTTSCKEGRLEIKPKDEQQDTLIITDTDFKSIESDSYIMLYQIRSVSKNRIQKIIGTINDTDLMVRIDLRIAEIFSNSFYSEFCSMKNEFEKLNQELYNAKLENDELNHKIKHIENEIIDLKKIVDNTQNI